MSWSAVRLADVTLKPQYGAIARGSDHPIGPRFVRQSDLDSGTIDWSGVPYCDLDPSQFDKYAICGGDLLVSRLGNGVGNAAIVRDPNGAVFAGYLVRFRADTRQALPEFLGYQLRSSQWKAHVRGYRSGAAQPTLNARQMGEYTFSLPPLDDQRAIAATLGALDDTIDSNQRVVELVPKLIRSRVDCALGESSNTIPVIDLARFVNGGAFTKGASGAGRMVVRIAELNSGPGPSTVYHELDVPDDRLARPGDLLMSWSGSLGVYRWARDEAIVNQHIFKVLPKEGFPDWLVFDRLDAVMPVFQGIAKDKATTMGHIQRGHLEGTTVSIPSANLIAGLDLDLGPLWASLLHAERQILRLGALRDVLLPELLSGNLRALVEIAP